MVPLTNMHFKTWPMTAIVCSNLHALYVPRGMAIRYSNRHSGQSVVGWLWEFATPKALGGLLFGHGALDDTHDVGFFHDEEFLTVDLDLGPGPFAKEHGVAALDV